MADFSFKRNDTQYNVLRKILGTLQGGSDGSGGSMIASIGSIGSITQPVTSVGSSVVVDPGVQSLAAAYSAGESIGGAFEIPGAIRVAGKRTILHSANLVDIDSTESEIHLYLFSANPSGVANSVADSAAVDMNGAESLILGKVTFDTYVTLGGLSVCTVSNIGVLMPAASGTSLWGVLVINSDPTFTVIDALQLKLGFLQD